MSKTPLSFVILILAVADQGFSQEKLLGPSAAGLVYRSEVNFDQFAQTFNPQQGSELCWAASISNVFGFYGHTISQANIVSKVFGSLVNAAAPNDKVIAQQLNRQWTDDDGNSFNVRLTAAYDFDAGVNTINNTLIVDELKNGRPLIICNRTHCMVLTRIDYTRTQVLGGSVFDPLLGPRELAPTELIPLGSGGQMRFIASFAVRPVSSTGTESPSLADTTLMGSSDATDWRNASGTERTSYCERAAAVLQNDKPGITGQIIVDGVQEYYNTNDEHSLHTKLSLVIAIIASDFGK